MSTQQTEAFSCSVESFKPVSQSSEKTGIISTALCFLAVADNVIFQGQGCHGRYGSAMYSNTKLLFYPFNAVFSGYVSFCKRISRSSDDNVMIQK